MTSFYRIIFSDTGLLRHVRIRAQKYYRVIGSLFEKEPEVHRPTGERRMQSTDDFHFSVYTQTSRGPVQQSHYLGCDGAAKILALSYIYVQYGYEYCRGWMQR